MNKSELISKVSKKTNKTVDDVALVVNTALDTITDELKAGEKVALVNFGTFETKVAAERVGRNPRNPQEKIMIPSKKRATFKASKTLKDGLNNEDE